MSLIISAINKEKDRILSILDSYSKILDALPRGILLEKTVKNNKYFYLQYREGKKVISSYVGKDNKKIEKIKEQLEKRKHTEKMIDYFENELAFANKITEVKK